MRTTHVIAGIGLLSAIGCGRSSDWSQAPSADDPLARGISIGRLTFNQGVSHVLRDTRYGKPFGQPAVVQDRDGLLRVAVDIDESTWEPREIVAVVEFRGVRGIQRQAHSMWVEGDGLGPYPETTFDFEVPARLVAEGSFFTVTLHDPDPVETDEDPDENARFDLRDEPWTVLETGVMHLHVVPVRYTADGSARTPDTSPARLAEIAATMRGMYPVTGIDLVVEPPLDWGSTIQPNGGGWESLLGRISDMRLDAADLPPNTYFYGLFEAAPSEAVWCGGGGCVLGLSNFGTLGDIETRASIGIGFPGRTALETMAHEVGHAHGRDHAPCGGASGVDPGFPYSGAALGTWGWNIETGELVDPNANKDVMSYCSPVWVSDYTWHHLARRTADLNALPGLRADTGGMWQRYAVEADGAVLPVGEPRFRPVAPVGKPYDVLVEDAEGTRVETARWFPSSHIEGAGHLLLPVTDGWDPDTKVLLD
ncbi:MAG: hypothetical protein H6737_03455 [Alphaproteobacteria bacterium]|nr:hypothetical protein [Alphaproteobacteria bacterium]